MSSEDGAGHGTGGVIRVALVDDDDLMRAGLRMIVDQTEGLAVVGEASTGREAISMVATESIDVVLMDVRMPDLDGIEATRSVTAAAEGPRVIILTTFDEDGYVFDGLQAGASGFLLKRTPPEQLVEAIRVVAAGESLLSPAVTRRVIERATGRSPSAPEDPRLELLTEREREVLVAMARGWSNGEISERLYIAENTTKTHVKRVLTKLQVRDRVQAVVVAYESGLMN